LVIAANPSEVVDGLADPGAQSAMRLSAWTSVTATLIIFILGTPLAYVLSRRQRGMGRIVESLVDFPLLLPPAVAGVALLLAFGRAGLVGPALSAWGIELPFTALAVIAAQVFVAAPLFIRAAALGFAGVSSDLNEAAEIDGSNSWSTFRKIQMPLAVLAVVEGLIIAWARALGEFGATLIFAGNYPGKTQTMPIAIYLGFEFNFSTALALSATLLGVSLLVLLTARLVRPRVAL
jgi:molybdate transport system permease protein